MGLGSWIDGAGEDLEHLATGGEHLAGQFVEANGKIVSSGLNELGLHGAAKDVQDWSNTTADHLGAQVGEMELGQSTDPEDLIHGDAHGLEQTAERLGRFAAAFSETGEGLCSLDSGHWQGSAAEAFRAKYTAHFGQWLVAAGACTKAATALTAFASTVTWAQSQARHAIEVYQQGQDTTAKAQNAYNAEIDAYNKAAGAYNHALAAAHNPGPEPVQPGAFTDPGTSLRKQAIEILAEARRQRDSHGREAAAALDKATALAPREPGFLARMGADEADLTTDAGMEYLHFSGGLVKGAASLVDFGRGLNPFDIYNLTHPAQYATQLSSTAAGILHAANHPTVLAKSVLGSGWRSDPSEAGGRLVANLASGLLTDGGSEGATVAADVAKSGAENTATTAAEDSLGNAMAELDKAQPHIPVATSGTAYYSGLAGADGLAGDAMKALDGAKPDLAAADASATGALQDAGTTLDHVPEVESPKLNSVSSDTAPPDAPGPSRITHALEPDRFPPSASEPPPQLAITDQSARTADALAELGQVPTGIFNKVSAYLADLPGGGISVGDAPLTRLPGGEALTGTPRGWPEGASWDDVAGVYMPGSRRLLINSGGASASGSVPLHEFGHAADDAFGNLSAGQEFAQVQARMRSAMSDTSGWNSYYNHPSELWAEGFAAWAEGGDAMLHLTAGNTDAANILKGYYDGILG